MDTSMLSVGIDIGTSTTSMVVSRLHVQNTASCFSVPRVAITGAEIVYRGEIYQTPQARGQIDADAAASLLEEEYRRAGITPEQVQTGAVIITGESSRKENAALVTERMSRLAGEFVVATAGPDLESIIAAKGAGTAQYSEEHGCTAANFDVGGGTTNIAVFRCGQLESKGCWDVGGRLIRVENGRISYVSPRAALAARDAGVSLQAGDPAEAEALRKVTDRMAEVLCEAAGLVPETPLCRVVETAEATPMHLERPADCVSFSGGVLAPLAAASDSERVAAKEVLSNLLMSDLRNSPAVAYEEDDVTRMDQDGVDSAAYERIKNWTVGEFREWLLSYDATEEAIKEIRKGLTAEMIAGVAKLMSNMDLVYAAGRIRVESTCNTTAGRRGTFSTRLQPNHPTGDVEGITASLFEGLSYGAGDMLIGLNPVNDSSASCGEILRRFDEVKNRWQIPSQICVLAHITTQMDAVRKGAPTDMIFQSIAGSQKGNEAFGFTTDTVREAQAMLKERGTAKGPNVMYFETGQGSELSSGAHFGADQVTMEARCCAKQFSPFMVNTVAGFIGPEYLYDSKQVLRAGLEDHFMGKLTGIPMGCDCCCTNHMQAE